MAKPAASSDDETAGRLPRGWPRPGATGPIERKTGLNPKRQFALVALALAGIGVGYLMGSYLNPRAVDRATPPTRPAAVASTPDVATNDAAPTSIEDPYANSDAEYVYAVPPVVEAMPVVKKEQDKIWPGDDGLYVTRDDDRDSESPSAPDRRNAASDPEQESQPRALELPPHLQPAWQRHALKVPPLDGRPTIVIVIDDVGVDRRRSRLAANLPGPLNLAYLSYAEDLTAQVADGRAGGHEVMMHVSMEPESLEVDPGPNVLLTGLPEKDLLNALRWNLDQFEGYVGINNHMGSRFTQDAESMRVVMGELKRRGLLFLDSLTAHASKGRKAARAAGVPHAVRDIFIDHNDDRAAIRKQLAATERVAKRDGVAIAIGHPRDNTLAELEPWLMKLADKGFRLAPLSAIIKARQPRHSVAPAADKGGQVAGDTPINGG